MAPSEARAGVLASLFGTVVSASGEVLNSAVDVPRFNSQNMGLLEVSSLSLLALADTNEKIKQTPEGEVKDDANIYISGNALEPTTGPLGVSDGTYIDTPSFDEGDISVYVVNKGDSLSQIADMFGITVDTILSANDMKKGDKPKEGDVLLILPYSGVSYLVEKGDTLQGIANKFKVKPEEIVSANHMEGTKIVVGDSLIIPGGELLTPKKVLASPKPRSSSSSSSTLGVGSGSSNSTSIGGYFIKPIPCRISQGKHDRYAVDLSCRSSGIPIKAAASGRVILAKVGWNGAFGNLVIIAHPNGTQTFYAHQSKIAVSQGDQVNQGQIIGYVGSTGRSTGPHLHFEVRGAKNPGFDNSWAVENSNTNSED